MISGQEDRYQYIPVNRWIISGDSLRVEKYIDEGIFDTVYYPLQVAGTNQENIIFKTFWLGTDKYGRDILSRLIIGIRVSLSVGCIAILISLTLGIVLGALAGYYGGKTDDLIMWLINVIWSIPTLLLVFAITLLLGKGF